MSGKHVFKAGVVGFNHSRNLDGTGWPDSVVLDNGLDVSDKRHEQRDYVPSDRMEQVIADNLALIDRNRDLECELAQLKAKLGRVVDMARDLHSDARTLSELFADGVMPMDAARECAVKHGISERIMDAIK